MNGIDGICFNSKRELLHPKFESYKLKEFDYSTKISRLRLPNFIGNRLPDDSSEEQEDSIIYSFEELKSRSRWNHLIVRKKKTETKRNHDKIDGGNDLVEFIWIEPLTLKIWTCIFKDAKNLLEPEIKLLYQLEDKRKQKSLKSQQSIPLDFPSGFNLGLESYNQNGSLKNFWLILDGSKFLTLVDLDPRNPKALIKDKELSHENFPFFESENHENFKLIGLEPFTKSESDSSGNNDLNKNKFYLVLRSKFLKKILNKNDSEKLSSRSSLGSTATFYKIYILELEISFANDPTNGGGNFGLNLKILTELIGKNEVESVKFDRIHQRWCFGSTLNFKLISHSNCNNQKDGPSNVVSTHQKGNPSKIIDKQGIIAQSFSFYNWYQDSDSLTITFKFPLLIKSKSLSVRFGPDNSSFQIKINKNNPQDGSHNQKDLLRNFLEKVLKGHKFDQSNFRHDDNEDTIDLKLWNKIRSDQSIWYIESSLKPKTEEENGQDEMVNFLTIELEKKESSLRWIQLFEDDDSVLESLDPIELKSMANSLNRITNDGDDDDDNDDGSNTKRRKFNENQGLGLIQDSTNQTNKPSLSSKVSTTTATALNNLEIDEEIDSGDQSMKIGIVYTWLTRSGDNWMTFNPQKELPVEVISLPLPLILRNNTQAISIGENPQHLRNEEEDFSDTIMIKRDTEGLVFKFPDKKVKENINKNNTREEISKIQNDFNWDHVLTYPGLAFVMASKRDLRFSFYIKDRFNLIFENNSVIKKFFNLSNSELKKTSEDEKYQSIGNLFVYHHYNRNHYEQAGQRINTNNTNLNSNNDRNIKSRYADQNVIKLSQTYKSSETEGNDLPSGYLLGVIGILTNNNSKDSINDCSSDGIEEIQKDDGNDEVLVMCLCQSELIFIRI